jgi:hypothetical protein
MTSLPVVTQLYQPRIQEVFGGFINVQDRSTVTITGTSFVTARA